MGAVSGRFVNMYMPQEVWAISYYEHMDQWFPNFDAIAPQKGGVGFTSVAGNSFMDWMTYLSIRLVGYIARSKDAAHSLTSDNPPPCDYSTYTGVAKLSYVEPAFLAKEVWS